MRAVARALPTFAFAALFSFGVFGAFGALGSIAACSASNTAQRDPMKCERDPACARARGGVPDCTKQCNDDPECVDRCREAQVDHLGHP